MKQFLSFIIGCFVVSGAVAAPGGRARVSMANQMDVASRATVSRNEISAMAATNTKSATNESASAPAPVAAPVTTTEQQEKKQQDDVIEKARRTCMSNNIGVGNTFVWASRYSNLSEYSTMVEDVDTPENNTCFVRVGLVSDDERIDLSDIEDKYFEMGKTITCGSWVAEEEMRQRILDAKKKVRVWSTVGASVGGAALGVGAMELFGNKLLGKGISSVEGQKGLQGAAQKRSQLLVLQKEDKTKYDTVIANLKDLKTQCNGFPDCADGDTNCKNAKAVCDKYKEWIEAAVLIGAIK